MTGKEKPTRVSLQSSSVKEAEYDQVAKTLLIVFVSGATYTYQNVPQSVYNGLLAADSAGKYLLQNVIKANYSYTKVS
ncbi:MAG: KTSC domain-containing protein [Candidatus Glassbacteria bacterium]|nr:KTSC domain-containing protein [Candidatus Glassbacteria bacterium]